MTSRKINPQILDKIRENSEGDDVVADFLVDLIYEEVQHSPGWWWRKDYEEKVKQYSREWSSTNEN